MTSTAEPIVLNFNGGEVSSLMDGRVDTAIRSAACRTMKNGLPLRQGPVTRRPGTYWVAHAKTASDGVWLIDFAFDRRQSYLLEIGPGYLRFFTQGGVLLQELGQPGGGDGPLMAPYELAHDWDEVADFTDEDGYCRLDIAPRGDRLWIVNGRRAPLVLSRLAALDWTIETFLPEDGPFLPQNETAITLAASAATGTITLTASADLWTEAHDGCLVRLLSPNFAAAQPWRSGEAVTSSTQRRNDGRVYEALNSATTSTIPPTHDAGTASDGAVEWAYLHPQFGTARITEVTSATAATATVLSRLPDEVAGASSTARWQLGAWSSAAGRWPSAVTFFRERLTFGRGRFLSQSRTGDYGRFQDRATAIEQLADDAIELELVADYPIDIRWLAPARNALLVGAERGELLVRKQTETEPYGPLNVTVDPVTDFGAAALRPIRAADQRILMLQAAGSAVIELAYRIETDAMGGRDLTIFAEHLAEAGIVEWAWQARPDGILWARTRDGRLIAMTYSPEQEVVAWHRHELGGGGRVKRLRVIPRPTHDELWLLVERGEGENLVRSIERMARRWRIGSAVEDYFGVDAGLSLDSEEPVTAVAGLDHLEGLTVVALTDGAEHPPRLVRDGAIELAWPTRKGHFGLPFETDIETMTIEAGTKRGSLQGRKARVQSVVARLLQTLDIKIGEHPDRLRQLVMRSPGTPLGSPEPPISGDRVLDDFPGDWTREPRVMIRMAGAGPGTIVALMPQLVISR